MELVMPEFGLLFWMLVSFSILFFILKKFAWKPILKALADRENSIDEALKAADKAKEEMARLQEDNQRILKEAMLERDKILKEARELKDSIVSEAKNLATVEANKVLENAKIAIEREKTAAIEEMKNSIAIFSLDIAEKILKDRLTDDTRQKELVKKFVDQIEIN
ncbi:F0F1 ATP synthase subunit B [Parabacteroides sp. FAFU027]|uniref:F0F1 ATP synthase subunit B n=1 Tax=Parabacteroides sp. FAFU027 TaxID=2922715 RepID=UPI001FAFE053|nr:F0F1 ATP synthase subunit B [Parabacteroides sp. FAFU027]